jgi:hypothetical protein
MELSSYDQPNILFLRGCFIGDCNSIEDMFDEQLVNQSMPECEIYQISDTVYDEIPKRFTSKEKWINKTNIKCWSCDCNFHNVPVFVPTSLERSDSVVQTYGSMDVLGNFCSCNCAAQYINLHFTGSEKWEKHELLKLLHKMFTGSTIDYIVPSPPKTLMKQYGGKKTQQEYREILMKLNDTYKTSIQHNSIGHISM